MQTDVISIVTCDICIITDLHAFAKNCVKVSTVGENISHDASLQWTSAWLLQTARPTLVHALQQLHLQMLLSRTP